jgi:hypothetical protein
MEMMKKVMMCLVLACFLSAGFAASSHVFACKCEGSLDIKGEGIDWLNIKGRCGLGHAGGDKGDIKNEVKNLYDYISASYAREIMDGTVDSSYDPYSGWRCVKRNIY